MLALAIDGVMIVLLVLVLVSSITLNRHLQVLRDTRRDFETMLKSFDHATARAEGGIKSLQLAAGQMGEGIQAKLEKGRALRDELSIMIDSANSLAQRLEAAAPGKTPEAGRAAPEPFSARSRAEQDLLRAMGQKREGGI